VRPHDPPGGLAGGDDDRDLAEPEEHDRAVAV
jgi:hypothetical protein